MSTGAKAAAVCYGRQAAPSDGESPRAVTCSPYPPRCDGNSTEIPICKAPPHPSARQIPLSLAPFELGSHPLVYARRQLLFLNILCGLASRAINRWPDPPEFTVCSFRREVHLPDSWVSGGTRPYQHQPRLMRGL
ncbi:hypothetical protein AAHC03_013920 [Spirometra sp. Aus1]